MPENPTLIESLSTCYQIQPVKPIGLSHISEIFGELHFDENKPEPPAANPSAVQPVSPRHPPPPSSSWPYSSQLSRPEKQPQGHHSKSASMDSLLGTCKSEYMGCPMHSDCFLSMNSETHMVPYTEGLGFESSDEVEAKNDCSCERSAEGEREKEMEKRALRKEHGGSFKVSRVGDGSYPPPLTCMGKMGNPCFRFQSYKRDGRFILREVKIPTMEFMHAYREDGRLKLHLVQPDDTIQEDEEEEDVEGGEQEEEEERGLEEEEDKIVEGQEKSGMMEGVS